MDDTALIDSLTRIANRNIDFPLIGENLEAELMRPAIAELLPWVPDSVRPYLVDAADGITDAERQDMQSVMLNNVVSDLTRKTPLILRGVVRPVLESIFTPLISELLDFAQGIARAGDVNGN